MKIGVKRLPKNKGYSHNLICKYKYLNQAILDDLEKGIYLYIDSQKKNLA